ncbi:hypothetical protein PUN28_010236 [Cardiocondyla obscurior]|uniref:Ribosomal protein S14 n=1 Tax=Cardiocondyla obscurior TaxID=286306 RepID=A0AAW2FR81_9HYME
MFSARELKKKTRSSCIEIYSLLRNCRRRIAFRIVTSYVQTAGITRTSSPTRTYTRARARNNRCKFFFIESNRGSLADRRKMSRIHSWKM